MTLESSQSNSLSPQHRRRLRNFLLLKSFQLKYTTLFAGSALLLSVLLGSLLARTSSDVLRQSREAVEQGRKAVEQGRKLVDESQKVSAVVRMSLVKSSDYADHPELAEAFRSDNQMLQDATREQQQKLERQALALASDSMMLEARQRSVLLSIFGLLSALVVTLAVVGIVFTHKVAGPVYKMTRYLKRLRGGSLVQPAPLRRGDDLREFFDEFCAAIGSLRERQQADLLLLRDCLEVIGEDHAQLRAQVTDLLEQKARSLVD